VDACHSLIEQEKKRTAGFMIMMPWDWQQIAQICCIRNPFQIINMETEDFKDFKQLYCSVTSPFIFRKTDDSGNNFGISKIVHLQVEAENYGTLYYKTSFDEKEFTTSNSIQSGRRATFPEEIPNLRNDANAISTKKCKHLQTFLKWVPKQFHDFYKNLKYSSECGVNDDDE
ncbi:hypothetical protein ILUMI_19184, partial [Ignelater luminosus]